MAPYPHQPHTRIGTEQDEKWAAGNKYLDMAEFLNWRKTSPAKGQAKIVRLT